MRFRCFWRIWAILGKNFLLLEKVSFKMNEWCSKKWVEMIFFDFLGENLDQASVSWGVCLHTKIKPLWCKCFIYFNYRSLQIYVYLIKKPMNWTLSDTIYTYSGIKGIQEIGIRENGHSWNWPSWKSIREIGR